jgi:hypothetical protein
MTVKVNPYVPQSFPNLPGSKERYLPEELKRVAAAIKQLAEAVQQLDARLTAHGM